MVYLVCVTNIVHVIFLYLEIYYKYIINTYEEMVKNSNQKYLI